jgi:DNA-directed RNA polymerase subunit RPC12/RpoP
MSYMQFQQKCLDCSETWNAAFGIVGTSIIAQPPDKCPKCGSKNITRFADGWAGLPPAELPQMQAMVSTAELEQLRAENERLRKALLEAPCSCQTLKHTVGEARLVCSRCGALGLDSVREERA